MPGFAEGVQNDAVRPHLPCLLTHGLEHPCLVGEIRITLRVQQCNFFVRTGDLASDAVERHGVCRDGRPACGRTPQAGRVRHHAPREGHKQYAGERTAQKIRHVDSPILDVNMRLAPANLATAASRDFHACFMPFAGAGGPVCRAPIGPRMSDVDVACVGRRTQAARRSNAGQLGRLPVNHPCTPRVPDRPAAAGRRRYDAGPSSPAFAPGMHGRMRSVRVPQRPACRQQSDGCHNWLALWKKAAGAVVVGWAGENPGTPGSRASCAGRRYTVRFGTTPHVPRIRSETPSVRLPRFHSPLRHLRVRRR